jgi:hypothetical protein
MIYIIKVSCLAIIMPGVNIKYISVKRNTYTISIFNLSSATLNF